MQVKATTIKLKVASKAIIKIKKMLCICSKRKMCKWRLKKKQQIKELCKLNNKNPKFKKKLV
jgi:hypothetical protein